MARRYWWLQAGVLVTRGLSKHSIRRLQYARLIERGAPPGDAAFIAQLPPDQNKPQMPEKGAR